MLAKFLDLCYNTSVKFKFGRYAIMSFGKVGDRMYQQKIGISIANSYSLPMGEVLQTIKTVGFDAISPIWESEAMLAQIVELAKANGLELQSLHAPFHHAADLWSCDESCYGPAKKSFWV